jgi:hypothetical protein
MVVHGPAPARAPAGAAFPRVEPCATPVLSSLARGFFVLLLTQEIAIDGGEYLLARASAARMPGYTRLGVAETRWVLRDLAMRQGLAVLGELCRTLGVWRSPHPPGDVEDCIELLAQRFDVSDPDLVLFRKVRVAVALDLSEIEDVVDLAEAMDLTPEPELHWVEITFHDADGNPLSDAQVSIERPDGVTHEGRTNGAGVLRVSDISVAGECKVSFPELEAWVREHFQVSA